MNIEQINALKIVVMLDGLFKDRNLKSLSVNLDNEKLYKFLKNKNFSWRAKWNNKKEVSCEFFDFDYKDQLLNKCLTTIDNILCCSFSKEYFDKVYDLVKVGLTHENNKEKIKDFINSFSIEESCVAELFKFLNKRTELMGPSMKKALKKKNQINEKLNDFIKKSVYFEDDFYSSILKVEDDGVSLRFHTNINADEYKNQLLSFISMFIEGGLKKINIKDPFLIMSVNYRDLSFDTLDPNMFELHFTREASNKDIQKTQDNFKNLVSIKNSFFCSYIQNMEMSNNKKITKAEILLYLNNNVGVGYSFLSNDFKEVKKEVLDLVQVMKDKQYILEDLKTDPEFKSVTSHNPRKRM